MLLQNHFKGRVKLWNVKIGYSYSEHIEMNDRVSHKSSCSPRERSELGSPIPLHTFPKLGLLQKSWPLNFFPSRRQISMLVIHEQPYLDLNGNHSNFGSVGKRKKKLQTSKPSPFKNRTEDSFFFFLRSNKNNRQTSVHFRENYIQEQVKPLKYILSQFLHL